MTVDALMIRLGEAYRHANVSLMIGPSGSEAVNLESVELGDAKTIMLAESPSDVLLSGCYDIPIQPEIQNDDFGSSRHVAEYELARGRDITDLVKNVNMLLTKGWQPFGTLVIGSINCIQPMVKYTREKL